MRNPGAFSFILILSLSIFGILLVTPPATAASAPAFANFEVSRSADSSFAGVSCPNSGTNCWNWNAEPNIATAPDGTVYATSENAAFNSTLPLSGAGTISGTSVVPLSANSLVLGSVYPSVVTVTYSDGTTSSQSYSVTYTIS